MCEKKPGANLPGVVHHKLWRGQLRDPVPHPPVHSGRSPRVVVVAQEVDGLAVLPGDGTHSSLAPEFVPATFGQPPAEFLGVVVLAAWHDGARGQDSQLVLQQVEERDGVVKVVHEQHVVLVGDLRVLHKTADNTAGWSEEGPVAVPDPARVDFCVEDVARLGLAQQEALDAPSDWLVAYVLLDDEAVLGGNHALVEAELLAGAETNGVHDEVVALPLAFYAEILGGSFLWLRLAQLGGC